MSEYFYWRYRLKLAGGGKLNAQTPAGEIEGALLRDRLGGHACLQPWEGLGQGDLDASLAVLKAGGESGLLASCRRCMALDGTARAAGIDLFVDKMIPRSHLTVPNWADFAWLEEKKSAGFNLFKLKCGVDLKAEARRITGLLDRFEPPLKLRLDFNECLDLAGLFTFVSLLGKNAERLDFVEDPVPYDPEVWQQLTRQLPFDLAVDQAGSRASDGFAVRVVKPAWEEIPTRPGRIVFTSAMDHPIGQLFAAHEAAIFEGEVEDCGLLTHWLFEADEFSEALGVGDRRLLPPGGVGLGFDDLLESLPWRAL
ncbi:MAG: O-succinylbenzoate synthase [Verrucomicrobiales bacterium]|jgi:O-succinylbenzoate synthase